MDEPAGSGFLRLPAVLLLGSTREGEERKEHKAEIRRLQRLLTVVTLEKI